MVDQLSPLSPILRPGRHGNADGAIGVTLAELQPGSILQLAAWHGQESAMTALIAEITGLSLTGGNGAGAIVGERAAFGFAPGKFLVVDQDEGLADRFVHRVGPELGTVTDLSHGRTAIRISGPKAGWVLAKFFAIDFGLSAFPLGSGISTAHRDIFAQIQRTGENQFDIYVFRSFARSFWKALCVASEETGCEVQ